MIELKIFFNNKDSEMYENIGMPLSVKDCDTRKMIFYNINAISPWIEDGEEYCMIHANGEQFICTESYENVKTRM